MLSASFLDQGFNVERPAKTGVKFAQTQVDLGAQAGQNFDPVKQFARNSFARRLRQRGGFGKGEIERIFH